MTFNILDTPKTSALSVKESLICLDKCLFSKDRTNHPSKKCPNQMTSNNRDTSKASVLNEKESLHPCTNCCSGLLKTNISYNHHNFRLVTAHLEGNIHTMSRLLLPIQRPIHFVGHHLPRWPIGELFSAFKPNLCPLQLFYLSFSSVRQYILPVYDSVVQTLFLSVYRARIAPASVISSHAGSFSTKFLYPTRGMCRLNFYFPP